MSNSKINDKKQGMASGGVIPRFFNPIIFLLLFCIYVSTVSATQIIVDINGSGQTTSIQSGINMAINGDTVLVMPGIYFENINFNGKTIVLASQYLFTNNSVDINQTIIDGNMQDGVVKVISGEGEGTRFVGFTVQNGLNLDEFSGAGGVSIENSTLNIEKCKIIDNYAIRTGGVESKNGTIALDSCIISNNRSLLKSAGGLSIKNNSSFYIKNTSVNRNFSLKGPGGVNIHPNCSGVFDSISKNSVFLNYGIWGTDMLIHASGEISKTFYFDTITSLEPQPYNIFCTDGYANHVPDVLDIHFNHVALESSNGPLYVNPEAGDNQNTGLNADEPLKNIYYALLKLHSDENNPGIIYMANGTYGNFISGESFPLVARDYSSLIGDTDNGVIWDGQDTSILIHSFSVVKDFTLENIKCIRGGNPNDDYTMPSILTFNNVYFKNISISETQIVNRMIFNGQRNNDSSFFENIKIENTYGNSAFEVSNYQENEGPKYCELENISIIRHLPIIENEWNGFGGALHIHGSENAQRTAIIKNLLLAENQYENNIWSGPSAMALSNGDYTIINATVTDNLSDGTRAIATGSGNLRIYNSIFFGNETGNIQIHNGDVEIYNSLVYGGANSITYDDNSSLLYDNTTNLNENPYFSEHEDFFYYLLDESPCINSGTSEIPGMDLPETDIIGNPRVYEGQVDMGAYEYVGPVGNNDFPYPQEIEKPAMIQLFPNPLIDYTKIEVKSNKRGKTRIYITDLNGYLITELCNTSATTLKSTILFENNKYQLAAGTYLLTLEVDGEVLESQQMVVVR